MSHQDLTSDVLLFGGAAASFGAYLAEVDKFVPMVTVTVMVVGLVMKLVFYWREDYRAQQLLKAQQEALCDQRGVGRDETS